MYFLKMLHAIQKALLLINLMIQISLISYILSLKIVVTLVYVLYTYVHMSFSIDKWHKFEKN